MSSWACGRPTRKGKGPPCSAPKLAIPIQGNYYLGTKTLGGCPTHLTDDERSERAEHEAAGRRKLAVGLSVDPYCWSLAITGADRAAVALGRLSALLKWQRYRCAICGIQEVLVDDHCHETGLVRGMLCRSCNTREGLVGYGAETVFGKYRRRNPATMLELVEVYYHPLRGFALSQDHASDEGNPMTGVL